MNELQAVEQTPVSLIALAIESKADIGYLERLMALQGEWEKRQAKKAFDSAKAEFQFKCPPISKSKTVEFNKTKYSYAPLSDIADTVKATLQTCGFSYRWDIHNESAMIGVTCHLTHIGGHSECNTMQAPADDSGAKNVIQQYGSTVTYLQRYTLSGVLGITSADEDDDGKGSGALNIESMMAHVIAVRENFHTVYMIKQSIADNDLAVAHEQWHDLGQDLQGALWRAPTKGGIFTTKERDVMKSDEWFRVSQEYHKGARGAA